MDDAVPVSVTVIARDEERNIGRCLRSVRFAADVVVLDSGSTDRTREVAEREGARVFLRPWLGYAAQKNHAAQLAQEAWILSLDADEWLDDDAASEIRAIVAAPSHAAYGFRRLSAFSGAFLPRTWSPDVQVRLYRKDVARFVGPHVHESLAVDGGETVGRARAILYHLTHRSVSDQAVRLNRYSDLASRTAQEAGRRFSLARMVLAPAAAFLKMYVAKRGAADGIRGLIAAADHAHYVFLKSAKLWDRTRGRDADFEARVPRTAEDPDPGAPYAE